MIHIIHKLLVLTFIHNCDNFISFFHIVSAHSLVNRCPAVQIMKNKISEFFFMFCNNAHSPLDILSKNKVIQKKSVKIGTKNAENNRLFIIHKRCRKSYAHPGKRYGLSKLHMQIFIHNLCHNIQSPGGCIPVKKNTATCARSQNVADYIQLLASGHGLISRKSFFIYSQKNRKHNACIYGFYSKFFSTGQKTNNQKHHIHNHGNCGKRQRYKVGQYNSQSGNAAY